MGRTIRKEQTAVKGTEKTRLKSRVVFLALLVIILTLFSINRLGIPHKSPLQYRLRLQWSRRRLTKRWLRRLLGLGMVGKIRSGRALIKSLLKKQSMTIWQRINLVQVHLELVKDLKKLARTLWFRYYTLINMFNTDIKLRALHKGGIADTIGISV